MLYEPDPRHVELLIKSLGLEQANSQPTPGVKPTYPKDTDKNNSSNDSQKFDWSFYQLRHKLQKNFGVCITLCSGLWGSPLCPLPKKTTIVFGKPIWFESSETPKSDSKSCGFEPTSEELDKGHALFVKELTALFDEHKTRLGYGDRTLEVI